MSQKEIIIKIYEEGWEGGCSALCTLMWLRGNVSYFTYKQDHRAFMASVSSQLRKLVKENILKVTPHKTGARGGMVYQKSEQ